MTRAICLMTRAIFSDPPFRCFSYSVRTRQALCSQASPQELPTTQSQFRFTGKVSKSLLSKFPTETAVFLSAIEKLFATNASRDNILVSLKAVPCEAAILSNAKRTCDFAQEMVKSTCPERAMHVLHVAHQLGLVLPHNQYEQVAYQLAIHKHWKYLQVITTMAREVTGSWTVRLLNWAVRSNIETQDYGLLDAALATFDRHQIKPTRRTYHLLLEGYLRNSDLARARDCLVRMQASGFEMNQSTYCTALSAYRSLGPNDTIEAQAFHTLQGTGDPSATMILNGLMKMRIDDRDIAGAFRVLRLVSLSPSSNYDTGGHIGDGGRNVTGVYSHLLDSLVFSIPPDNATFNILLMLLAHHKGELQSVFRVFRQMISAGLRVDPETVTALVVAYSTANMIGPALSLVYEMCKRHNIPVEKDEFHRLGHLTDSFEGGLEQALIVCPTVNVFNALLRALLPTKGLTGMWRVLRIMRQASVLPDASTTQIILTYLHDVHHMSPRDLINVLRVLAGFPANEASFTVQHLNTILRSILRREIDITRTTSWNASAQRVRFGHISRISSECFSRVSRNFDPTAGISLDSFQGRISKPFKPIVETLINRQVMSDRMTFALRIRRDALVKLDIKSAQRAFDTMVARGIRPNAYHFSALIEGYAAIGSMNQAKNVLDRASHAGVKPNVIMYTILIQGYGRLGKPDLAKQMFTDMVAAGVRPDFAAIDAVVSAFWFVRAYKTARSLLLDLWPLVAPFPPQLQGAPLHVLVKKLRDYRGTSAVRPIESRRERQRRIATRRIVLRTLFDLTQWQEVAAAVSWAKTDVGLRYMLRSDTSGREHDWF